MGKKSKIVIYTQRYLTRSKGHYGLRLAFFVHKFVNFFDFCQFPKFKIVKFFLTFAFSFVNFLTLFYLYRKAFKTHLQTAKITSSQKVHNGFLRFFIILQKTKTPEIARDLQVFFGAPQEIRTPGLRFRRPTLYPAELAAQQAIFTLLDIIKFVVKSVGL